MAIWLRQEIGNEWTMALRGLLWVLLGVVLTVLPGVGPLSLAWLIGVYALGAGLTLLFLAFRVRGQSAGGSGGATWFKDWWPAAEESFCGRD